jgi:hypothetical protein
MIEKNMTEMNNDYSQNTPTANLGNQMSRRSLLLSGCALVSTSSILSFASALGESVNGDDSLQPVPFTRVDVDDQFWAPRMEANREVSIWHCLEKQRITDFQTPRLIEGAAYMIAKRPYPELEQYVDKIIDSLVDEVIDSRLSDPDKAVRVSGHFLEASVAYYAATGKRKMLDAALRDVSVIDANFGPGKRAYISDHEGQKIGLLRLYRQTGDQRCATLAQFFMDGRGRDDYPYKGVYANYRTYAQDQRPVVEQEHAVGHCVRATYLYIALAEMASLFKREDYEKASDRIWQDAVYNKTYLTGGIGSIRFHEQFGAPYELPNLSAWNETCAAYGNVIWNHDMFLLHRDAKYVDMMERVLYNGFACGVSIRGDRFFYQNPLKSFGNYDRYDWINVPCCPPNVVRLTASIGSYIYAQSKDSVYVNLFAGSRATISLDGDEVTIRQETRYPWDGAVTIHVQPSQPHNFTLLVRIPGWARNQVMPGDLYRYADGNVPSPSLAVNGKQVELQIDDGYARLNRKWQAGDVVQLQLPMPVRRVQANNGAMENRDMVALERGPLVYCAEWPDNGGRALNIVVPDSATFESRWSEDLLNGVQVVTGNVQAVEREPGGASMRTKPHELRAIPYYSWANRGMGEMATWLPRVEAKAWIDPIPPETVATVNSSGGEPEGWTGYNDQNSDIRALYDGHDPISSADESYLYFKMMPEAGAPAWMEYRFKKPTQVSSAGVYWYDDRRFCVLPSSWQLLYQHDGQWVPVATNNSYAVQKDQFNTIEFSPVTTAAIRLVVEPANKLYRAGGPGPPAAMPIKQDIEWREFGVLEWRVS